MMLQMSGECTEGGESSDCGRAAANSAECSAIKDTRPSVSDDCSVSQGAHLDMSGAAGSRRQLSTAGAGEQADYKTELMEADCMNGCVD